MSLESGKNNFDILDQQITEKINKRQNLLEVINSGKVTMNNIHDLNQQELDILKKLFNEKLSFIYGDQEQSFNKLFGPDRYTILLKVDDHIGGILGIKSELQDEKYSIIKKNNGYIEIKSLLLLDDNIKGQGIIYLLFKELNKYIKQNKQEADGIFVTVSKNKAEGSYKTMLSLGFQELQTHHNLYSNDNFESFLFYDLKNNINMPKIHHIPIKQPYFSQIESGTKTTEGRSGKMYNNMKIGDIITFQNKGKSIDKTITGLTHYKTLQDYLDAEGYQNCIPHAKSFQDAINAYDKIPGYNEKISKGGIIGIQI